MNNRNKHGSFLATSQKKFLKVGFAIAISAVIVAFNLTFHNEVKAYVPLRSDYEDVFQGEEIEYFVEKKEVPVASEDHKTAIVHKIEIIDFDPVEKTDDKTDKIIDIDDLDKGEHGLSDEIIKEVDIKKPTSYAEVMPAFPGGETELLRYLSSLDYCQQAIDMDKEGKVYIQFIVNEKGKVKKAEVIKGVYPCLDNAALNIVKNMPDWSPGKQGFENVPVIMTVPINFVLN